MEEVCKPRQSRVRGSGSKVQNMVLPYNRAAAMSQAWLTCPAAPLDSAQSRPAFESQPAAANTSIAWQTQLQIALSASVCAHQAGSLQPVC